MMICEGCSNGGGGWCGADEDKVDGGEKGAVNDVFGVHAECGEEV